MTAYNDKDERDWYRPLFCSIECTVLTLTHDLIKYMSLFSHYLFESLRQIV